MEQATKIQTDTPEEPLIDIFYKDTYRLNSLVSQINQGALQSVTTTLDDSQGSIHSTKADIGIPKALGIGSDNAQSQSLKQSIQKTKSSYDDVILELLAQLELPTGKRQQRHYRAAVHFARHDIPQELQDDFLHHPDAR